MSENKQVTDAEIKERGAALQGGITELSDDDVDAVAGGTGTDWGDDYEGRAAAEGKTWLKGRLCGWCGKETVYGKKLDAQTWAGVIIDEYHYCWCYSCEKPHAAVIIPRQ